MQIFMLLAILGSALLAPFHVAAESLPDQSDSNRNRQEPVQERSGHRHTDGPEPSCGEKASSSEYDSAPLPSRALAKLDVHAGFGYGIFSGTLHNANPEYAITQVTVLITPAGKPSAGAQSETGREFNLPMTLKPNSTGALSMLLPSDHTQEYSWKITRACGYKVG
jgi:hypothetical protein